MTDPSAELPRESTAAAVVGTVLFVGALVLLPIVGAVWYIGAKLSPDDPPSCDRDPMVLEWIVGESGWRRSESFELDGRYVVQVDVRLSRDGGFIQTGKSVYAVPAGEPFPSAGESSTTTRPFPGIRVGHGIDAVNEQVRLDPGVWELMVRSAASSPEVRWPC